MDFNFFFAYTAHASFESSLMSVFEIYIFLHKTGAIEYL